MIVVPSPTDIQENARTEYNAVVAYHTSQVSTRFVIAGFFLAATGFLVPAILQDNWSSRIPVAGLGCLLSLCAWILELRTRALYTNLAMRGIDIEHRYWKLTGPDWYNGFFSRQRKVKPNKIETEVPPEPLPDCPKVAWMKNPLPPRISKHITHSMAFDLLYPGTFAFWFLILCFAVHWGHSGLTRSLIGI